MNRNGSLLVDEKTSSSRLGDAAATNPPGIRGNRWMTFGTDGTIAKRFRRKVRLAADRAYGLNERQSFLAAFRKLMAARDVKKPMEYVEALDIIELNLADTCSVPAIQNEVKEFQKLFRDRPDGWKPEGGFAEPTQLATSGVRCVYIYRFALQRWSVNHLAGLIAHEASHVAGVPGDMVTEMLMQVLDESGYPRGPQ